MANETTTPANTATQAVILQVPPPGQTVVVNVQPNQVIEVPFDMAEANVTLVGDDLHIEFPGNAVLILNDFAAMVDQGVSPLMMFADGSVVAGDVLLTALSAELPETAAGPAGASGGAGSYEDDMGALIGTVDRLGAQNPDPFAKAVDLALLDEQPALPPTISVGDPGAGLGDITIPEGTDAIFSIFITDAAAGSTLTLTLADRTAINADYHETYFQYSTDGGATWSDVTGPIPVPAGNTNLLVKTDTVDDNIQDSGETFELVATLNSGGNIVSDSGTATITDIDQAIEFSVTDTKVTISEELGETDAFTVAMDQALNPGNSASVVLSFPGTASDGTDYAPAIETAIANAIALLPAGHGVSYDAATNTLTFAGTAQSLTFAATATNDDALDGGETIAVSLGSASATEGSASVSATEGSATVTITDIDQAITFAINVISEDAANDTSTQQAAINEKGDADDLATFSITMAGYPLAAGNTASVDINFSGTSSDADFMVAALTSLGTAVGGMPGVTLTGNTLTFDSTYSGAPITFSVEAIDESMAEGDETLIATLSNQDVTNGQATIVAGQDTATVDILDAGIVFPSGLAYTVAGSKVVDGEQLYSVDLETGQTVRIGEVLVNGVPLGPNSTTGMEMNPDDGYLYAVVKKGGDSWLLKINPTTAESEVIDQTVKGGNDFSGVTAAAFDIDGTYYLAFSNKLYAYDLATNDMTLIAQGANSVQVTGLAIAPDISTVYLAVADDLYKVVVDRTDSDVEVPVFVGQIVDANGDAYTLDGLSVDDNGTLWGLDNAGNILEIDPTSALATHVTTLAVNEVTGSGAHTIAISNVDPGTYVVLSDVTHADGTQDLSINDTTYLADDGITRSIDPEDDGWPATFPAEADINVTVTNDGFGTVTVDQSGTDLLNNVYVQSDNEANVTVNNFNNVEIQARGDGPSTITVNDALRGIIDTGEGDDIINLNPGTGVGSTFTINADGGNDTINLNNDALDPLGTVSTDIIALSAKGGEGADVINNFNPATDVLRFYDVLDSGDAGTDIGINDLTGVSVDPVTGPDVVLHINGVDGPTQVTLEGVNSGGSFTGDASLSDLVAGGLQVQVTPDTYSS